MSDYVEKFFKYAQSMNDRYQCAKCHEWCTRDEVVVEHEIPVEKGGTDDLSNLKAVCKNCLTLEIY